MTIGAHIATPASDFISRRDDTTYVLPWEATSSADRARVIANNEESIRTWEADIAHMRLLIGMSALVTFIGTAFVLARLYVRVRILKRFFLDDGLIAFTMVLGICSFTAFATACVAEISTDFRRIGLDPFTKNFDYGDDYWDRYIRDVNIQVAGLYTNVACSTVQGIFGRLSILVAFSRIVASDSEKTRNVRRLIQTAAFIITVAPIPMLWIAIDPCWPPSNEGYTLGLYGADDPVPGCIISPIAGVPTFTFSAIVISLLNSIMDLFIFALPFVVFRWAALPPKKKRRLYALFGFGFVVSRVVDGVIEVYHVRRVQALGLPQFTIVSTFMFAIGEANGVMVAACLPVLKRLRKRGATSLSQQKGKKSEDQSELGQVNDKDDQKRC